MVADPASIILGFLNSTIEAEVRAAAAAQPLPTAPLPKDIALREWLQALGHEKNFKGEAPRLERLEAALQQWTAPVQRQSQRQIAFRTCFYLHPPTSGQDWTLEYFLQSVHDPDFLVSARVVWNNPVDRLEYMGRTIEAPQETLLAGLGLASRLYPVLEPSLQTAQPQSCQLNPLQVYEFIKATAWRLQDSGFGVILPPNLANQEGWANRLGLRVQAETPKLGKNQRLGLQSLLNFKWELTIGGQRLSRSEFDRLVALKTPLVEINGEWVELRPQDIRAAQAFFESRKDQTSLSLEDALRISTGDTQMIEKLPVLGFDGVRCLARADQHPHFRQPERRADRSAPIVSGRAAALSGTRSFLASFFGTLGIGSMFSRRYGARQNHSAHCFYAAFAGPRPAGQTNAAGLPHLGAGQLGTRDQAIWSQHQSHCAPRRPPPPGQSVGQSCAKAAPGDYQLFPRSPGPESAANCELARNCA